VERENLYEEYHLLMYHEHQSWEALEAMPVYDRKWFVRRLLKELKDQAGR